MKAPWMGVTYITDHRAVTHAHHFWPMEGKLLLLQELHALLRHFVPSNTSL